MANLEAFCWRCLDATVRAVRAERRVSPAAADSSARRPGRPWGAGNAAGASRAEAEAELLPPAAQLILSSWFVFQVPAVAVNPLLFTPCPTSSAQANEVCGLVPFSEASVQPPVHSCLSKSASVNDRKIDLG